MDILNYFIKYNRYLNILGIFVILIIATIFSQNRSHINLRLIINAIIMQFVIAYAVLRTTFGHNIVQTLANGITHLYSYANHGAQFIFGNLTNIQGPWGFIFAIKVLPIIIFFGAFMALLFYFGIIQKIISGINFLIQPLLGTTGAETLCAIANSFGSNRSTVTYQKLFATYDKIGIISCNGKWHGHHQRFDIGRVCCNWCSCSTFTRSKCNGNTCNNYDRKNFVT